MLGKLVSPKSRSTFPRALHQRVKSRFCYLDSDSNSDLDIDVCFFVVLATHIFWPLV